jgi:hypothetical protein
MWSTCCFSWWARYRIKPLNTTSSSRATPLRPGDGRGCGSGLSGLPSRAGVTGAEVSTTLLGTTASLKAELRRDAAFVAQLREFLRGRLSELVEQANQIVGDLMDEMRRRWTDGEWKGLVVIVDSLDHNCAVDSEKFQQVRRALVNLFDKDYDNLRLAKCRTVFTLGDVCADLRRQGGAPGHQPAGH